MRITVSWPGDIVSIRAQHGRVVLACSSVVLALGLAACGKQVTGQAVAAGAGGTAPAAGTTSTSDPFAMPSLPGLPTGQSGSTDLPGGTDPPTIPGMPGGQPSLGALPDGFPVPPGATSIAVVNQGDQVLGTLDMPAGSAPDAAVTFYKDALPKAGYTITEVNVVGGGLGLIKFSGKGFSADSQIAFVPGGVAFQLQRGS